jgi:two-component system, OmpR family, phosphate regulon sensor histidine kinase PhoR
MFSFRQKIFFTYIIVFLFFVAITFPLATYMVRSISAKVIEDRTDEIISKIQSAPNNDALVRRLKEEKQLIFFRISIIDNDRRVIYDSHAKRLLGPRFSQEYVVDFPDVMEAFESGEGSHVDYSELFEQKFFYFAKAFDFHGKRYVIRTAFPYKYVADLTEDTEISFLGLISLILLLFSILTWLIINHFTKPIQQIINAVTPYQEGKQTSIPEIHLKTSPDDEFGKLALTLNSLSAKIQKHIDTLTAERNEKAAILESLVEGVIAVDGQMQITYSNKKSLKMLGKRQDELIGQNFDHTILPQGEQLLLACQKEKKVQTNTLVIEKDRSRVYLDIVAAPIADSRSAIFVIQDQSAHYKMLEMRKEFVANASHELKTPITIIRGFAEALHDNPDLPRQTTLEVTAKIVKNCQRMTALIKDLLTLSDIENLPSSRLIECDLYEIVQNCCKMLVDMYPTSNVVIHKKPEEEIQLIADPGLMELALMNLIENAAKYSTPPAQIDITLQHLEDKIMIEIADKGIGIPPENLEHIFDRFYRVDTARSQKLGGFGLGLSIVQTVVHKHFGQISVQSERGKGTAFTLILPYTQELQF